MLQNSAHTTDGKRRRIWPWGQFLITLAVVAGLGTAGYLMARQSQAADEKTATTPPKQPAEKTKPEVEYPRPHKIPMPADIFDGGTAWLNTSGPIELKDLKGKIVLIDFWTFCCINCIHVLPDLKYLEHKYPNELVVIGCHSAKFDNEKDSENIRKAILRYEIEHPVVNDSQMRIWNSLGIRSWPSLLVVDAEGNACLLASGEGNREYLDELIQKLIKYHKANDTLDETPIRFDLEQHSAKPNPLRFPGKLLTDVPGNRLFISDSNHNRIVVTTLDGQLKEIIGAGTIGASDGEFTKAEFDHPQGMALVDEKLYITDTENHLLRVADLKTKKVSTLAGTGEQARQRVYNWKLKDTALNSPWDVIHADGWLYIAMAGPHQLWSHKIGSETIQVYAGTGMEDIQNGPLSLSAFAQPSGLASDGKFLYVCDSEGSSIRKVPISPKGDGKVETVVGAYDLPRGAALFEFGDIDDVADKARLQHPLGIAHHKGSLYVADSYNHKIKHIDLKTQRSTTWLGDGKSGEQIKPAPRFAEPAGLAIAKEKLYIADTNNHRILTVDLKTKAVTPLVIAGLEPPKNRLAKPSAFPTDLPITKADPQTVKAGEELSIKVNLQFPEDYKLNPLYPTSYRLKTQEGQVRELIPATHVEGKHKAAAKDKTATWKIPLTGNVGETSLEIALTYGYCRDGKGGLCKIKTTRFQVPLKITKDALKTQIELTVPKE